MRRRAGTASAAHALLQATPMTHTFSTHRFVSRRARPALHPVALATLLALSGTSVATQAQTAPVPVPVAAADAAPSLPAVTVSASGLQLGASDPSFAAWTARASRC